MKTPCKSGLILLAGLAASLLLSFGGEGRARAADDLGEAKPFESLSESKPAMKAGRTDLAEGKPRFVLDKSKTVEAPDYVDLVFVASDRPVLVRLHLRNNGRPSSAGWDDYLRKLYAHLDRNGDGTLDKAEAERAPDIQFLQFHLQGSIGLPYRGLAGQMAQLDTNKDGKVSFVELSEFYRRGGMSSLQLSFNSNRAATEMVTNTLYKRLDKNKDTKLSAEEMTRAEAALQRLDLDENELLTVAELTPGGGDNSGVYYTQPYGETAGPNADMGFLEVKADNLEGVVRQVLTHYDKGKNGKLSRTESGLDKALFDALDSDRDGQLDAKEFAGFFHRDSDLELIGRMGKMQEKEGAVVDFLRKTGLPIVQPIRAEVFNPSKRPMLLATKVRRTDSSALGFSLGDARINLSVAEPQFTQNGFFPRQFFEQQFRNADTAKKGVLDRKQATSAQFLSQIFNLVDRDGDDKITEKELKAYLDMQTEGANSQLQATITDEGRSLFDVLDENGDGSLSIRELRTSWARMKPLAKSDRGLSRPDITRRLEVSLGQQLQRFRGSIVTRNMFPLGSGRSSGPLWFQKMDRNRDGDISPREFVGSEEDFRKLDADGDGLISSEEARQFEQRLSAEKLKKEKDKKD